MSPPMTRTPSMSWMQRTTAVAMPSPGSSETPKVSPGASAAARTIATQTRYLLVACEALPGAGSSASASSTGIAAMSGGLRGTCAAAVTASVAVAAGLATRSHDQSTRPASSASATQTSFGERDIGAPRAASGRPEGPYLVRNGGIVGTGCGFRYWMNRIHGPLPGGAERDGRDQPKPRGATAPRGRHQNFAVNSTPYVRGSLRKPVRLLKSIAPTTRVWSVRLRPNTATSYWP